MFEPYLQLPSSLFLILHAQGTTEGSEYLSWGCSSLDYIFLSSGIRLCRDGKTGALTFHNNREEGRGKGHCGKAKTSSREA
jgi:hypothetical protein